MIDVGVGLWCMRSTASAPAGFPVLYRELQEDARLAEELGYHSLWLSEHHFWYDGWCPALLVAGAAALGATERLHVGTGVFLLPLHDPERIIVAGRTLGEIAPGRFELGFGIGYRDQELDGLGLSRKTRGKRVDLALDRFAEEWRNDGPSIWVGGIADVSLRRAAERGLSLFLPSSMRNDQLAEVIARLRDTAAKAGVELARIGVLKNAWVTDGAVEERRLRQTIADAGHEYGGAWWNLQGNLGFDAPELLERQMARAAKTALVGPPAAVAEGIRELEKIGVDYVVLHLALDLTRPAYRDAMHRIAADVLPELR